MKKIFLIYLLILLPNSLMADGYQKPDSFFQNNEVASPLGRRKSMSQYQDPSSQYKRDGLFEGQQIAGGQRKEQAKKIDHKKDSSEEQNTPEEFVSGNKIINLGLIVNAVNKKHFEAVAQQYIDTIDQFDLDGGHVYLNGYINSQIEQITILMTARGSSVSYPTPPAEYNVSVSPTWIVQLADGQVLLEGVEDLNRYINKKGEFVEKGVPLSQRVSSQNDELFQGKSLFE